MKLSDRMEKIVNMCGRQSVWSDIGCDHGRVSAELVLREKAERVIAADVSELSLYKAKDLSSALGLAGKIDCRHGDGLTVISPNEARGAVIAGMGAPLIIRILEQSPEVACEMAELILSPNNYPDRLREWLIDNGFDIIKEVAAEDDMRFYPIIKAVKAKGEPLTESEKLCGRNVDRDKVYERYLDWLIGREEDIIKSISDGGGDPSYHEKLKGVYMEVKHDNYKTV